MMRAAFPLLAMLLSGLSHGAGGSAGSGAPFYSAASIVNAATNQPGALAPNTIITIYGEDLSWETRALTASDIDGTALPTKLPGTGVTVLVANVPAPIYFVSPGQVNVLIPSNLRPGKARLQLARDGRAGPEVEITLASAAPALFLAQEATAVVTRADGSIVGRDDPAHPGEIVVLYATGLGPTSPETPYGMIPTGAAQLERLADFRVLLGGREVDPRLVLYAGAAPGFAGLYQVNLWLPDNAPRDPQVRLALGDAVSVTGVLLPVAPTE